MLNSFSVLFFPLDSVFFCWFLVSSFDGLQPVLVAIHCQLCHWQINFVRSFFHSHSNCSMSIVTDLDVSTFPLHSGLHWNSELFIKKRPVSSRLYWTESVRWKWSYGSVGANMPGWLCRILNLWCIVFVTELSLRELVTRRATSGPWHGRTFSFATSSPLHPSPRFLLTQFDT